MSGVQAVGPKPLTIICEHRLAPRRLEQTVLRESALAIHRTFEKGLTVANHHLSLKTRKQFELGVEFSRQPNIIRVEKRDKLTTRQTRTRIPRSARPASMFESQQTYAIAKFALEQLGRRIGGRIVNHDHLDFTFALRERAMDCVAHQLGTVPRRNHNAEQWSFHFAKRT
jgi:hypothetical protein